MNWLLVIKLQCVEYSHLPQGRERGILIPFNPTCVSRFTAHTIVSTQYTWTINVLILSLNYCRSKQGLENNNLYEQLLYYVVRWRIFDEIILLLRIIITFFCLSKNNTLNSDLYLNVFPNREDLSNYTDLV